MKYTLLLFSLVFAFHILRADERAAIQLTLPGIDQAKDFCIRRDGLSMIVIEHTKKGEAYWELTRSSVEYEWTSKKEFQFIPKEETFEGLRIRSPFYSYDDKRVYFSANLKDSKGGLDIYYLNRTANGWSDPVHLDSGVNTELDEYSPSLSGDGRNFYFLREINLPKFKNYKTGAIYYQTMDRDDHWMKPELLTEQVNQTGIRYVKVYPDNMTLLYSEIDSKLGWQIKWTRRLGTRHWFLPQHLSITDDKFSEFAPNYCAADGKLYFVEGKLKEFSQSYQMFIVDMPKNFVPQKTFYLTGQLTHGKSQAPISGAELVVYDKNSIDIKGRQYTDEDGKWELRLLAGESYMLHIGKENYTHIYQLLTDEETVDDLNLNLSIFTEVELLINAFDTEDFRPLESTLEVISSDNTDKHYTATQTIPGQYSIVLPVGNHYHIIGHCDNYFSDTIELAFENQVLYHEFERDIDLDFLTRDVQVKLYDAELDSLLTGEIEFVDTLRNQKLMPIAPNNDGMYDLSLREGQFYHVEVSGTRGYSFYSGFFDLNAAKDVQIVEIPLEALNKKVAIQLNLINFEYNSAALLEASFVELNRVVKLLNDNPDISLEISAHTDNAGSDAYNLRLSQKRAQSVVDYLEENQIDYRRLIPIGYGEKVPLVENDTELHRKMNRRVEMRLSDKVIVQKEQ